LTDQPDVSIIIVNHHADRILGDCIRAVMSGESPPDCEIIVVDNPAVSGQGPLDSPSDAFVIRIPVDRRVGFGAACNIGASRACGKYLLFLNPDVVVEPGAVRHLLQALSGNPDAGIAIGRLTATDGDVQATCRRFPTPANLLFSHGSVLHKISRAQRGDYMLPDYEKVTEVDWGAAALMMIVRERFNELSGFDERFFMYLEDTDLCYRLHQVGGKVVYVPEAKGVHRWGYSTQRYRFRRILWHHRSLWRYFAKHHRSFPRRTALAFLLPVNCLLSLLIELFTLRR
jgi:GT2 family glycosyltransferase